MKFTKGYWMNRPGVSTADAVQIRQVRREGDRLYLYVVPYPQDERGLGGPVLEMYVNAPAPDILRIQACHFIGSAKKIPQFELNFTPCTLDVQETENTVTVTNGRLSLVIQKNPCDMTFYWDGEYLTRVGNRFGHAMISTIHTPEGPYMRAQLDLDVGEKVYGLGERFTPFVKNGQVVDMWNEDGGTCSEIAYKNIPFYLTNRGYGVLVNSSDQVSFEICSEVVTRVQFSLPGESLDFMVIGGGEMKGVLERYTGLTGRPALPPAWTFGLWLSSSFTTSYDEETVNHFVDGMAERGIPLSVFHFDCFWMSENEWCNFTWDSHTFPDPKGMLARMKARGLHICVWINSYIGQKSPLFKEAMEHGYLLRRPNGDVWQWDLWQAGMGLVDFTNPNACEWFKSKLRALLEMGVDCFKTDFGERIPTDCVYFDGSAPQHMHNYYTYLYNKTVFEVLEEYKGKGGACLFARSATVGGQKFPVHWGGDCSSNYVSMAESLRGGLSLALSGFGFWSHDMSGFEGTATPDVYKRWAAFGLLSTHSRLHGSQSYRVPWLFDEESVDVLRFFSKLKCRLMPYLYDAAVQAHEEGIPVMRAMVLAFPGDIAAEDADRQYMLGENLLVAPVFREDGRVDYYLPAGRWTHLLSGETVEGGGWRRETYDYFSLPLFIRSGSLIALGEEDSQTVYDYTGRSCLHLFDVADEQEASCRTCSSDGVHERTVSVRREGNTLQIHAEGRFKNTRIQLRNMPAVLSCTGCTCEETDLGSCLTLNSADAYVTLK